MPNRAIEPCRDPVTLLDFWFGVPIQGFADPAHRRAWFRGGAAMDQQVRARFADLPEAAASGMLANWLTAPRGRLAWILVCDQLPRHLFRGRAEAFGYDTLALEAARGVVADGSDRTLGFDERAFCYLPFEHSEQIIDQHTAVGLFAALRDQTPTGRRHLTGAWLRSAVQHRDLIQRFGRFPHRNAALGRASSPAELTYLADGRTFGQG